MNKQWVQSKSGPETLYSLIRSLKEDLVTRWHRYEIIEAVLCMIPGLTGKSLRYIILKRFFKSIGRNVVIWPGVHFRSISKIEIGNNVQISYGCIFQGLGGISIGNNTLFGPSVKVWSTNHIYRSIDRPINTQGSEHRHVSIGSDCWITSNVFIKPGSIIPDGTVILPYSVVAKMKIPKYSVLSGNPAKVVGPRNRIGAFIV